MEAKIKNELSTSLCACVSKGIKWIQTPRAIANSEEEQAEQAEHAGELQAHIQKEEQPAKAA